MGQMLIVEEIVHVVYYFTFLINNAKHTRGRQMRASHRNGYLWVMNELSCPIVPGPRCL